MEENEFFDEVECELDIFNDAPLDKKKEAQDDVHKDAKPKTKNLFEDLGLQNDDDDDDSLRVTSPLGQEEITPLSHNTAIENAEATSSTNHKQVRKSIKWYLTCRNRIRYKTMTK